MQLLKRHGCARYQAGASRYRSLRVGACVSLPVAAWLAFAPLSAVVATPTDRFELGQAQPAAGVSLPTTANEFDFRAGAERAALARLEAQRSMAAAIAFPPDVVAAATSDPRLAAVLASQRLLFDTRLHALLLQLRWLKVRRDKAEEQRAQLAAHAGQAQGALAQAQQRVFEAELRLAALESAYRRQASERRYSLTTSARSRPPFRQSTPSIAHR